MTKDNSNKNDNSTISISDAVHWRDSIKKDVDFSKPDDELTPEQLAQKVLFKALDTSIEDSLGKEDKQKLDQAAEKMEVIPQYSKNLKTIIELGKEVEKNLVLQHAYLSNHFDTSSENYYKNVVDKLTETAVDTNNQISNSERVNLANKIQQVINVYREKINNELHTKQKIISSILPTIEEALAKIDIDLPEELNKGNNENMVHQFREWLDLSKRVLAYREKEIEAVEEHIAADEIIPVHIIKNDGDLSVNISSLELRTRLERANKLIEESADSENKIQEKRKQIAEWLFGKEETYMDFGGNKNNDVRENQDFHDPLESKFLFRLVKIAYVLALLLGLLIVGVLGWEAKPTSYIDGSKTTINCSNGKNYSTNTLNIYLWTRAVQLDSSDDRAAKIACAYGVKDDYITKYNLPSTPNYSVNYVESTRGSWVSAFLWWGIGFVVLYGVLNLIREALNYMFFGRPFTFDWLIKLISFFSSPQN